MKHWRIGLLGAIVSVAAVYFLVSQVNIAQLGAALSSARYIYVLPCVIFLLLGLVTRAIRWRVLLSDALPLSRAFSILNVTYLVNGLLPLRIGELGRAYLATRSQPPVPVVTSLSTIIAERLLDLLAVIVLIALSFTAGSVPDVLQTSALLIAPVALVGFGILVLLARYREATYRVFDRIANRISLLQRLNVRRLLEQFMDGLVPLTRLKPFVQAVTWTAISWLFSVFAGYVLMFTFYPDASWAVTCLFIAAASLAIAVPAVPGNVGTYEASIILALDALNFGEPESTALAFAVLVHGVNLAIYALTGVIGFIQEGISLEQLSQGVSDMRQQSGS